MTASQSDGSLVCRRGGRVAVIGGGLAGLAAAVAAAEGGLEVELFEARRRLGGRAGSFVDPKSGQLVDHCQHVAMGCCTNWADFCRRTGIDDCFERHTRLWFVGPDAHPHPFSAAPLPAPFHLLPSLLRLRYFRLHERLDIVRAVVRLARDERQTFSSSARLRVLRGETLTSPRSTRRDTEETIGAWLRGRGQSDRAIDGFWSVVLASALGESPDRASLAAARKVFRDGFLAHRRAYELHLPRVPLGEIYDRRLGAWLGAHGVAVHRAARVKTLDIDSQRASAMVLPDGSRRPFDFFVVAVPWHKVHALFPADALQAMPGLEQVEAIPPAPIAAFHLWFDRPIMSLPHAVLIGRLGQWVFNHGERAGSSVGGMLSRREAAGEHDALRTCRPAAAPRDGMPPNPRDGLSAGALCAAHYYQVVISAAHAVRRRPREELLAQVRGELETIWPAARAARLLQWRLVTEPAAVFSLQPGVERLRPPQATSLANVRLAGDWTDTGWPATMEGAVRSGYLAVETILRATGRSRSLLVPDLPLGRLARWLLGT